MGNTYDLSEKDNLVDSRLSTRNELLISSIVFYFLHLLMNVVSGIYVLVLYSTHGISVIMNLDFANVSMPIYYSGALFAFIGMILGIIVYFKIRDDLTPTYKRKVKTILWLVILYTFFACTIDDLIVWLIITLVQIFLPGLHPEHFVYNILTIYLSFFGSTPQVIVSIVLLIILILFISLSKDSEKQIKQLISPYVLIVSLISAVLIFFDFLFSWSVGMLIFIYPPFFDLIGIINFLVVAVLNIGVLLEVSIKTRKLDMGIFT